MATGLDIRRRANVLLERHGEDAAIEASMPAESFLDIGEMVGYLVWKRIVQAVEEIPREERRPCGAAHRARDRWLTYFPG